MHGKTIIFGAGEKGKLLQLIRIQEDVIFLDDNKNLQGQNLAGIKIYNSNELEKLLSKNKIEKLIITTPSITRNRLMELFDCLKKSCFY